MNKQELIGGVAETTGLSRADTARVIETMLATIGEQLRRGDEVRLVGFGTFSVGRRKASIGRHPRTGAPIDIQGTSQPKFRAGKILKELVS